MLTVTEWLGSEEMQQEDSHLDNDLEHPKVETEDEDEQKDNNDDKKKGDNHNNDHYHDNDNDDDNYESPHQCWLCDFCTHPLACAITNFISDYASTMEVDQMVQQIRDEILHHFPYASGVSSCAIESHITKHVLIPSVKMASLIRSLTSVAETVRMGIHRHDVDADELVVDKSSAELYLKVTAQIMSAYKMDSNKLLFMGSSSAPQPQKNLYDISTYTRPKGK